MVSIKYRDFIPSSLTLAPSPLFLLISLSHTNTHTHIYTHTHTPICNPPHMRAVDKDQFPCVLSEFFDSSPLHRVEDDHLPRWGKGEYVSVCVCV